MRRLRTAVIASALAAPLTLLAAVPSYAEPLTCQGRAVTVPGNTGTDDDDVMVITFTPGAVSTGGAGAGNDVLCLRIAESGEPYQFSFDAGPGNDTVVNESTAPMPITTLLGTGVDSYVGNGDNETVVAGAAAFTRLGDTTDTEADTIDTLGGDDRVQTGSVTPGATNRDSVSTGDGNDHVGWAGEQVGNAVDLGAGRNSLSLHPGWQGTLVAIDATTRVATVDGRPALGWAGEVTAYTLALDNLETSFTGSDLDERLMVTSGVSYAPGQVIPPPDPRARRTIGMGAGDDVVELWDFVSGSLVGGAGHDQLLSGHCAVADVRLGSTYHCQRGFNPRIEHAASIDAWEWLVAPGDRVRVVGTDGPEQIHASGFRVRISGRGGKDLLSATARRARDGSTEPPAVIRGGAGRDLITGSFAMDRLLGGGGADRIDGTAGDDALLGGAGRDRLLGGKGADRLRGGSGRDRADGGNGRDRCDAEVRRSCER